MTVIRAFAQLFRIIARRLRQQGFITTLQWLRTVGLAWLTGRLSLKFSQVTPNIYLGPQYGRFGKASLEKAGVTASINMRSEFDDAAAGLALEQYAYLPTDDNTAPTLAHLQEGVAFIERIVADEGIVYVHCGSGVGRAPTMVAAYLIAQGLSVDAAIEKIRTARPFVRVLPTQIEQLEAFARAIAG
jgi:protein-tyrosine phosphatase